MPKRVEMIGRKFGKLTVLEMEGEQVSGRHAKWKCVCDCGKKCIRTSTALRHGKNQSCGCQVRKQKVKANNLVDKRFGKLVVLSFEEKPDKKRNIVWNCKCDCGNLTQAVSSELKSGRKRSCGCLHSEVVSETSAKHGHTRNKKFSPTYISWASMLTRCKNKNASNFKHYGGRGISVCGRWESFENFLEDMGERPEGKSIDRINVNGNYEPSNCKWATQTEQVANRRKMK